MTAAAAPDAFLAAHVGSARAVADRRVFGALHLDALADLVAHAAYEVDPAGLLGTGTGQGGAVSSVGTRELSNSFATTAQQSSVDAATARFAKTAPGVSFLGLRDSRAYVAAPLAVY